jgi:hypothetical protein
MVTVKSFKTFWRSLLKMAAWLTELGVTDAAMESTGVYWWPVYQALAQAGPIEVCMCNAAHMRNVPGRETRVFTRLDVPASGRHTQLCDGQPADPRHEVALPVRRVPSQPRTCSPGRNRSTRTSGGKRLVTSTRPAKGLPLKCHSPETGTRFHIRKVPISWSPLTESNRRPSPYHVSLCSSAAPGRSSDLREHEHTLALTSAGRAHTSALCHSICHSL